MEAVESVVVGEHYFTAKDAIDAGARRLVRGMPIEAPDCLSRLAYCVLTLKSGHPVTGEALTASNSESRLAKAFEAARKDALKKLWRRMALTRFEPCQPVAGDLQPCEARAENHD